MKRITLLAAVGVLVATPAVGAWTAFAATDDNPARDASNVRVDDRESHNGEAEPGDDRGQRHRQGTDDPAGHVRHSGELEPGDDHGGDSGTSHDSGSDDGGHHGGGED